MESNHLKQGTASGVRVKTGENWVWVGGVRRGVHVVDNVIRRVGSDQRSFISQHTLQHTLQRAFFGITPVA